MQKAKNICKLNNNAYLYASIVNEQKTVFLNSQLKLCKMKKYNYFYNGQPISKDQFISAVPKDWEKEVKNGEYSYGYYRAIEREIEE